LSTLSETVASLVRRVAGIRGQAGLVLALLVGSVLSPVPSFAETVAIPNFWDPRARPEKPDLTGFRTVRFLVDGDFPPLDFTAPDGSPTGFSVELARAACEQLVLTCTIQVRRFDTLLESLSDRGGDVVAAGLSIDAALRQRFAVTHPYFKLPARFAVKKGRDLPAPGEAPLKGRSIAVVAGTAHEAFAKAFFQEAAVKGLPDRGAGEAALRRGDVDYLFADGLSLALWIGGTDAADCCAFAGGPFLESRYFGEGIGFVLRKDDEILRRALDYALQRLWDNGKYAELYLRFFPVSPY
jgi:polar amino acid transport system substrate-binding protein